LGSESPTHQWGSSGGQLQQLQHLAWTMQREVRPGARFDVSKRSIHDLDHLNSSMSRRGSASFRKSGELTVTPTPELYPSPHPGGTHRAADDTTALTKVSHLRTEYDTGPWHAVMRHDGFVKELTMDHNGLVMVVGFG